MVDGRNTDAIFLSNMYYAQVLFNDEFYPFTGDVRAIREATSLVGIDKLMWGLVPSADYHGNNFVSSISKCNFLGINYWFKFFFRRKR